MLRIPPVPASLSSLPISFPLAASDSDTYDYMFLFDDYSLPQVSLLTDHTDNDNLNPNDSAHIFYFAHNNFDSAHIS